MREYFKKWSNYVISAVRYDPQRHQVTHLKRRILTQNGLSEPNIVPREKVIASLSAGKTYCTAVKSETGEWLRGYDLYLTGENFLKTVKTDKPVDFIADVPEF